MPASFSDPSVQTYSITDFTPGIHRTSRPFTVGSYAPGAPPGSAAHAYRCYAKPEIGLLPLPTYQLASQLTVPASTTQPVVLSMGSMRCLAPRGGAVADIVTSYLSTYGLLGTGPGGIGGTTNFYVSRHQVDLVNFAPAVIYSSQSTQPPANTTSWPAMDFATFQDPPVTTTGTWARTVITHDPISTATNTGNNTTGTWICVRGWHTPTTVTAPDFETGTFPLINNTFGTYPRVFYHNPTMGVWELQSAGTASRALVSIDTDTMLIGDQLAPTNIGNPFRNAIYPEMGSQVHCWGTWSTGEFVAIYLEGGAFIAYNNLQNTSTFYKLQGVNGSFGMGKGALTPIGMIYPGHEFVYVWNGDNVSQNISRALPEAVFIRTPIGNNFYASPSPTANQEAWSEWVFFPNNWMFDTATNAWWLCEDPNVINFQVFAKATPVGFVSSPGIAYAGINQPVTLNTYYWAKTSAAGSYFWQSNPIPVTVGALVTIEGVEIVVSNLSNTACIVTIQATSPPGQATNNQNSFPMQTSPYSNTNPSIVTFTIPPLANGYRATQRLGYADYNVSLAVTANNITSTNDAPTIHAINCFYTQTRPSGVTP